MIFQNNKCVQTGRPRDEGKKRAFEAVTYYRKVNDDEQITINEVVEKMGEYLKDTD